NSKVDLLGASASILEMHGAVSEEAVIEMAQKVRTKFNVDVGISASGIAGPGGGTPEKPVGTVWIAIADGKQTLTKKLSLGKPRVINIESTAIAALHLLWQSLTQNR